MTSRVPAAGSLLTSSIARVSFGFAAGLVLWLLLQPLLPHLPVWVRFALAWLLFTLGPGLALGARLTRELDSIERLIVCLGLGSAGVAVVVEALGRIGELRLFPFIVSGLLGAGVNLYRFGSVARTNNLPASDATTQPRRRSDVWSCALLLLLAFGIGAVVFAHRLIETPEGIRIYGDYDSFDLSIYAAWASEATHTVPPEASYYSGHRLHGAYYPQLVLAMIHRFAGVPLLAMYFGYAWPTFLALGGLSVFALVRALASTRVATLAAVLVIVGGDLSYLAAWLLPHDTRQWDYVLWPTNFLAPTMEVLHFNTWAPTLPVFFTALYAVVRGVLTRSRGWLVAAAFVTAVLFQFKPFAYVVLVAGLCGAFVFGGRGGADRRWLAGMIVLTGVFTVPLIADILRLGAGDQRSRLVLDFFVLPLRMLIKLNLTAEFSRMAASLAPADVFRRPILLMAATALFLLVGVGVRWVGAPALWRALRGTVASNVPAWRVLAWVVVAGVTIPFVLATEPYNDTLQFYQTGLYVWWVFAAVVLSSFAKRHPLLGAVAITAAIAAALPSSVHYLSRKWHDHQRAAVARLSRSEVTIAQYLESQNPEETVILHDLPRSPSLIAVAAKRRVVLGWGRQNYAAGSRRRVRDVDRFFAGRGTPDQALDMLRRYRVTHVLVRTRRNRVHPEVLRRLTPLVSLPDVVLYGAPAAGEHAGAASAVP